MITGNTGFKGSWLNLWLNELGAKTIGYSLNPPTAPNHFQLLDLLNNENIISDVRNLQKLVYAIDKHKPEILFHLAAQPIVNYAYNNPVETYETNIQGTVNVLEACRLGSSVKAIVIITSDKCYVNKEWCWGYRENDVLGGHDPYSASKACAEIIVSSYRDSFFNNVRYNINHQTLIASARAGNVIGGGDWAKDRLVPDIMIGSSQKKAVEIRNPYSTRPWQHVLEPLSGYLWLGCNLLNGNRDCAGPFNFGPSDNTTLTVKDVLKIMKSNWKQIEYTVNEAENKHHEAALLKLDCSKANQILRWHPVWNYDTAIKKTVNWYKKYYDDKHENMYTESLNDIYAYVKSAQKKDIIWSKVYD